VILGGVVVVCCLFTFAAHRAVIFTIVQLSCLSTGDFTPIKVMHTGTLLYLSHLVSYSPSRVLRSSSSSNLLQVPTLTLFSVPTHSVQLLQVFGTLFLTHSFHLVHSTLSGGTSKHTFTKQLLIPQRHAPAPPDSLIKVKVRVPGLTTPCSNEDCRRRGKWV